MSQSGMVVRLSGRVARLRSLPAGLRRICKDCEPLHSTEAGARRPRRECSVDDAALPLQFSTLCGLRNSQQQQHHYWRQGLSQPLFVMVMSCDLNAAEESTQCKQCIEVATNLVTSAGNEGVQSCTLEELWRQEPVSQAFLRTCADIKASVPDPTAVEGAVSTNPTAMHAPSADDAAAATDTATAPSPPAVVPRLVRSLSSPAVFCHRSQVEAPVVPECTPRPHRERTTSIGCPGEFVVQRNGSASLREVDVVRDKCPGPVTAQGSQVADLEGVLAVCEQQLEETEQRVQALRVMPVNSCEAAGVAGEHGPQDLETVSLRLSCDFEELAAEALELGCNRVPGAMDVFEQANAAMERIASCLRHCREMQASAKAAWPPMLTDAYAKGPEFQAVGGG